MVRDQRSRAIFRIDADFLQVSEIRLLKREELDDLIEAEDRGEVMLSPWFRLIAQKWLPMWWDALLEGKLLSTRDTGVIHKF